MRENVCVCVCVWKGERELLLHLVEAFDAIQPLQLSTRCIQSIPCVLFAVDVRFARVTVTHEAREQQKQHGHKFA